MEENSNMTAERSLKIITEQIEKNRRAVSKTLGQSLYISGLCIMATSVLVAIINFLSMSAGFVGFGHLLWFLLPVAIWFFSRKYIKERAHTPTNMVGHMVAKTWQTFAIFALGFFIVAIVCTSILFPMMTTAEYSVVQIRVAPIIVLLMGMAIAMNGQILNQRWLVWFGAVAGLLCFVWEHFEVLTWLLVHCLPLEPYEASVFMSTLPLVTIFIFGFVGLLLPGMMLKKQAA
ncbi:MAG: hypothetical protein IKR71_07535 [Bacteroidales bacterium]|nr:hypothetical protein [Bacteroidales bacterium]